MKDNNERNHYIGSSSKKSSGQTEKLRKIDSEIKEKEVLLVSEEGKRYGKLSLSIAQAIARKQKKNVMQINVIDGLPVVKILDYNRYLFKKRKKEKKKGKDKAGKAKEIRVIQFASKIDDRDKLIKSSKAVKILLEDNQLRLSVFARGRQPGTDRRKWWKKMVEDFENFVNASLQDRGGGKILVRMSSSERPRWVSFVYALRNKSKQKAALSKDVAQKVVGGKDRENENYSRGSKKS